MPEICSCCSNPIPKMKGSCTVDCTSSDNAVSKQVPVCHDCYSYVRVMKDVADIAEGNCRLNNETIRKKVAEYEEKKWKLKQILFAVKDPDLKNTLAGWMQKADDVPHYLFDGFYEECDATVAVLKERLSSLPARKADCGLSTFAVDDTFFYIELYGSGTLEILEKKAPDRLNNRDADYELLKLMRNDEIRKIRLEDIVCFQEKGDLNYTTSTDLNLDGVLTGGLLFGVAGALIGALSEDNIVESQTITHDTRYVLLKYLNEQGKPKEEKYEYCFYEVFNELIPEKEYSYVQLNPKDTSPGNEYKSIPLEELKKLKELLDMEIITPEEFEAKKKQLLGL